MAQYINVSSEEPIGFVRLARPEKRNALSLACMRELIEALESLRGNSRVRAVVLASSGTAFCAGHDLSEMRGGTPAACRTIFDTCVELMQTIQAIPQPVVAAVQGVATAAGCQLVASCDLAVASETATFATPGVRIGLFCTTPAVALTRAIGRKRALEMLLTGRAIDARTAAEWGLINRVVPAADLESEARALAARCAEASAFTTAVGKQAFYAQVDLDQPRAYSYAKEVMTRNALAADAQEGISAFLEKRPACWKHE